jgi:hypothetical protein
MVLEMQEGINASGDEYNNKTTINSKKTRHNPILTSIKSTM